LAQLFCQETRRESGESDEEKFVFVLSKINIPCKIHFRILVFFSSVFYLGTSGEAWTRNVSSNPFSRSISPCLPTRRHASLDFRLECQSLSSDRFPSWAGGQGSKLSSS
jgi:hypothetical protein